jgi:hypothetical protein
MISEVFRAVLPLCYVCRRPDAKWLCAWPVERKVHVPAFSIEVGDVWITQQAGKRGRVVDIEYFDTVRKLWVNIPGHPDPYPYTRFAIDSVETLRPGTCDQPCCDAHAREAGDERHYCADHWHAWEQIK